VAEENIPKDLLASFGIAANFENQGDFAGALKGYESALLISEMYTNTRELKSSNPFIGSLYMKLAYACQQLGRFDEGFNYTIKAESHLLTYGNSTKFSMAHIYNERGLIKSAMNHCDEAIAIFEKALKYANCQDNDKIIGAIAYINLGAVFLEKNLLMDSEKNFSAAESQLRFFNDGYSNERLSAYIGLGRVHLLQGKFKEAFHDFEIALNISGKLIAIENKIETGKLSYKLVNQRSNICISLAKLCHKLDIKDAEYQWYVKALGTMLIHRRAFAEEIMEVIRQLVKIDLSKNKYGRAVLLYQFGLWCDVGKSEAGLMLQHEMHEIFQRFGVMMSVHF
jgi:tetratricopeptide (TPR) repeat protein